MATKIEETARVKAYLEEAASATTREEKAQITANLFSYLATTNHFLSNEGIVSVIKAKLTEFSKDSYVSIIKPGAVALCAKLKTLRPTDPLLECISYLDTVTGVVPSTSTGAINESNIASKPLPELLDLANTLTFKHISTNGTTTNRNTNINTKTNINRRAKEVYNALFTNILNSPSILKSNPTFALNLDAFISKLHATDDIKPQINQVCNALFKAQKSRSSSLLCIKTYPLPLMDAIHSSNIDALKTTLNIYDGDINAPVIQHGITHTPLMIGVYSDKIDIIRLLLEAGADPNETVNESIPPLIENVFSKHTSNLTDVAVLFAQHGAIPTHDMYYRGIDISRYVALVAFIQACIEQGTPLGFPTDILAYTANAIVTANVDSVYIREECKLFVELCVRHGAPIDVNVSKAGVTIPLRVFVRVNALEDIFPMLVVPTNNNNLSQPLPLRQGYNVTTNSAQTESEKRKDDYTIVEEDGVLILTIPRGTLLYHSFFISEHDSPHTQTLKLMGGIVSPGSEVNISGNKMKLTGCVDQFMQKFFYSNPAGGPGLGYTTESGFNAMGVYETTRDMRFAVLMSPSPHHRLQGDTHPAKMQCDQLDAKMCDCSSREEYNNHYNNNNNSNKYNYWGGGQRGGNLVCPHAHPYDVCLKPEFLQAHRLDGHIAIASADSYNKRMKPHNRGFTYFYEYDKVYRILNRMLYDGGRSKDIRRNETLTGFPELVIHMFGTDWYNHTPSMEYEYTINLPDGHDTTVQQYALTQFLIQYNAGQLPTLGFHTSLRLVANSTADCWYNILRGVQTPTTQTSHLNKADSFYINAMRAHLDGDMPFYFDSRTGFLIHDIPNPPYIRLEDGTVVSFKEASMRGGESARGSSALERSYMARRAGTFWDKKDCLIHVDDLPARGGRRSTRRLRKSRAAVVSNHSFAIPVVNTMVAKPANRTRKLNRVATTNTMNKKYTMNTTPRTTNKPKREIVRLNYTPSPITAEQHAQITRALAMPVPKPASKTLSPYEMMPQTHALMQVLMTVSADMRIVKK